MPPPAPAPVAVPKKLPLVLSLLAAMVMLAGPAIGAMWMLEHPAPAPRE
jgi:hypothetical protein